MENFPIVELTGVIGTMLGGMWAMFRSLQKSFLQHLEVKNGHLERIAEQFNKTIQGFNVTLVQLKDKIDSIDERV